MKFFHTDVGLRQAGNVLEVTLSSVADVRMMDNYNFNNYKNGMKHIYTGGLVRESPIRLTVPTFGHWDVAININGVEGSGRLKASVKVLHA